ncbi:hypothetical protein J4209_01890 [Candidatus Woesearchaeota archaeon]|nr:hypothetical protein [Candidatus Woesearchaeota archaeon]
MSELRILVDHMKLEYTGLFDVNNLFRTIDAWLKERAFEKRTDMNQELNTPTGKFLEWVIAPWKKVSDYTRYIIKIRMLVYDLNTVEAVKDKKKLKLGQGRVLMYFDAYIEHDYEHRWDRTPMLIFLRTMYDKFIYRTYTERFEHRLVYDTHYLFDVVETFFNMYKQYRPVSKVPHFVD